VEPQHEAEARRPALFCAAGAAVAAISIPLAAAAGPPYLSLSELSPWVVVYAIGLFAALFATPFAIHARLGGRLEADARWERALLLWGAVALGALALGLLVGLPSGFDPESLAGSLAGVTVAEAVLVLGSLLAWLLAN
jgi:hypothetical protein